MKVKLLKKIRKRYSINHYPNGIYIYGKFEKGPVTILKDNEDSWRTSWSNNPKEIAYDTFYNILLKWIQKDYGTFRKNKKVIIEEKLWYKNK